MRRNRQKRLLFEKYPLVGVRERDASAYTRGQSHEVVSGACWHSAQAFNNGEFKMKKALFAMTLGLLAAPVFANQSCDELKARIESQIQGHGVKAYSLDIVAKGETKDGKVVGTCEGGTKEIAYKKK
jgi:hypothetical protein